MMYLLRMSAAPVALHWSRSVPPVAVLFDLDGTLIDSIGLILGSMRYAFVACDAPPPTDAEWLTGVGTPLATMFRRYAVDEAEVERYIGAYRVHQLANHDRMVRCYDDVAETLSRLREGGHPLAVVTSKSDALARRGLDHTGLGEFFATIVGVDVCTRHKPHPEPVLIALHRLGYEPRDAVFVGDSVHDIAAGNAAGVQTIAALWGPFSREELAPSEPTHFLERIASLPQLVGCIDQARARSAS